MMEVVPVPRRALHAVGREVLCREAPLLVEVDLLDLVLLRRGRDLDDAPRGRRCHHRGGHDDDQVARGRVGVCLPRDHGAGGCCRGRLFVFDRRYG